MAWSLSNRFDYNVAGYPVCKNNCHVKKSPDFKPDSSEKVIAQRRLRQN